MPPVAQAVIDSPKLRRPTAEDSETQRSCGPAPRSSAGHRRGRTKTSRQRHCAQSLPLQRLHTDPSATARPDERRLSSGVDWRLTARLSNGNEAKPRLRYGGTSPSTPERRQTTGTPATQRHCTVCVHFVAKAQLTRTRPGDGMARTCIAKALTLRATISWHRHGDPAHLHGHGMATVRDTTRRRGIAWIPYDSDGPSRRNSAPAKIRWAQARQLHSIKRDGIPERPTRRLTTELHRSARKSAGNESLDMASATPGDQSCGMTNQHIPFHNPATLWRIETKPHKGGAPIARRTEATADHRTALTSPQRQTAGRPPMAGAERYLTPPKAFHPIPIHCQSFALQIILSFGETKPRKGDETPRIVLLPIADKCKGISNR